MSIALRLPAVGRPVTTRPEPAAGRGKVVAAGGRCYPLDMMDSASRPAPHVHIYVTDDERRRRLRRRRLVLLSSVAVAVAVVAAGGVWALHALGGGASGPNLAAASIASGSPTPSVSPSATRTPSATPTPSASPTTITIGWVGDTTPGSKYGEPPNGGRALFGSMRALLSKPDLMIANLEGTYSTPGPSKCDGSTSGTCFAFQAPPSYAGALAWSGIDLVNMANNHSMDYLTRGYLARLRPRSRRWGSPTRDFPTRSPSRQSRACAWR